MFRKRYSTSLRKHWIQLYKDSYFAETIDIRYLYFLQGYLYVLKFNSKTKVRESKILKTMIYYVFYLYNVSFIGSNIESLYTIDKCTSNDSASVRFSSIHCLSSQWQKSYYCTKLRYSAINVIAIVTLVKSFINTRKRLLKGNSLVSIQARNHYIISIIINISN